MNNTLRHSDDALWKIRVCQVSIEDQMIGLTGSIYSTSGWWICIIVNSRAPLVAMVSLEIWTSQDNRMYGQVQIRKIRHLIRN